MSVWQCPRCWEKGRASIHLYGQTECKRCSYKKGSNAHYNEIEREDEERVAEMRRSLRLLLSLAE